MAPDPYRVLGVSPDAPPEELREAYRRLAKLHHPDSGGSPERFLAIQAAYDAVRGLPPSPASIEARMAEMERKLREARAAAERPARPREDPAVRRVSDLIDGLEDLASRLDDR